MGKTLISVLAVIANLFLAIGKVFVGFISKSASILADGINSGTDVIASAISFIGIKAAEKPADKEHPYGHGKAEVISGFIITIIIFLSAIYILYDAINGFFSPSLITLSYLAFVIMAISALVNAIMSYTKIHYGKKYDSVSLISDGIHSRIDLLTSLAIFIGLFFVKFYTHVDSILALLVGLYVLKESFSLGKKTTDSLLGARAGEETENKIKNIIKTNKIKIKELKTQKIGANIFAEIEIELPSKVRVEQANQITKNLEKQLSEKINNLKYISIKIKSLDIRRGYYNPLLGKGFGWQRKGRMQGEEKGPVGYCICEKCNYKISHERGTPCSSLKCPNCNINLKRE